MSEVRQNTETLKYIFDEQKAAEAASCLLSVNGGCLPYMKLIKLLYIADRRSLTMYHSSITTDSYFSMKFGPVPTSILDCIKHADEYPSDSPWNSSIKTLGYNVILKKTFSQLVSVSFRRRRGIYWKLSIRSIKEKISLIFRISPMLFLSGITPAIREFRFQLKIFCRQLFPMIKKEKKLLLI